MADYTPLNQPVIGMGPQPAPFPTLTELVEIATNLCDPEETGLLHRIGEIDASLRKTVQDLHQLAECDPCFICDIMAHNNATDAFGSTPG